MKKANIFLSTSAVVLIMLAAGCKENKETSTVASDTLTTNTVPITEVAQTAGADDGSVSIDAGSVPDSVRTSFSGKYPKAEKIVWKQYVPKMSDDSRFVNDNPYYYVIYYNDGADYTSWYDNRGGWVKTSTKVSGPSELPDAVNKTINAQYPGYTIVEIDKENDKDMDMYEIELKKGEEKAKLKILPDGTIFKGK